MFKKILEESILEMTNHTKFIRIAFFTSFFHSIVVVIMIFYNINNILEVRYQKGLSYNDILTYVDIDFNILIIILIIGVIGYEFIYPIGQSAMIHFLESTEKSTSKSIGKGIESFFTMFEFNNIALTFGLTTFFTTMLRLITLDIIENNLVIIITSIRLICVLVASILRPYTKYAINIEKLSLYDAIKRSSSLSITNIGITCKFLILEFILLIRFVINIIIILGIPLIILYIASQFNSGETTIKYIMYGSIIILTIGTTYLNGIIEAFFTTYRYKVYKNISKE